MQLPHDPARLRRWQVRTDSEELEDTARLTAERRFVLGLGLSQVARRLARGAGNPMLRRDCRDLLEKANLYVAPLLSVRP